MTVLIDTNIVVRHLVGEPPAMARRATAWLRSGHGALLTDVVFAETMYVLSSVYERSRHEVASAMRSLLALDGIDADQPALLLRAVDVFEFDRLDFADAYLVAYAESAGIDKIASFDRAIDRVRTVQRIEP